jgi:hypothetical protein
MIMVVIRRSWSRCHWRVNIRGKQINMQLPKLKIIQDNKGKFHIMDRCIRVCYEDKNSPRSKFSAKGLKLPYKPSMCAPWYLFRDIRTWHHFTEPSPAYLPQPKYEDTTLPVKIRTLRSYFLPAHPTSRLLIVSAISLRIVFLYRSCA